MTDRRPRRADLILIAVLLAAGVLMAVLVPVLSRAGTAVQVRVGGQIVASYPLDADREVEIAGAGGGTGLLVIEDGGARMAEASCPDRLCVGMGVIRRTGQSIVCLPNQIVVEIVGPSAGSVDAVSE